MKLTVDSSFILCYNNYTETEKEISTMSVPASYTLDAPTFNNNVILFTKTFNFTIRKIKNLTLNRVLVSVRFVDETAKTKFEDFLFRNEDY